MAVLLLLWRRPWNKAKRAQLFHRDARSWGLVVLLGCSLVLMNTLFYVAISNMVWHCRVYRILGPLSVAVITGKSWRERVGIGIAAVGVVLLAGISLANPVRQWHVFVWSDCDFDRRVDVGHVYHHRPARGGWRQFAG